MIGYIENYYLFVGDKPLAHISNPLHTQFPIKTSSFLNLFPIQSQESLLKSNQKFGYSLLQDEGLRNVWHDCLVCQFIILPSICLTEAY